MQGADQIQAAPGQKVKMLSSSWAAKCSTKYEVYLMMQTETKAYLPRNEHITICKSPKLSLISLLNFLKDLISGKKKYIK